MAAKPPAGDLFLVVERRSGSGGPGEVAALARREVGGWTETIGETSLGNLVSP